MRAFETETMVLRASVRDADARQSLAARGTEREHPLRCIKSDSQRRRWKIRRAVARAIETRNKIPGLRRSSVERNKEGDGFVRFRWGETKETRPWWWRSPDDRNWR